MSETHGNPSDPHAHAPAGPPEPKTPMWLPALGAVLFLTVGLIWGLMPASSDAADGTPGGAATAKPGSDAGAVAPH
jgi:hypothetical protein